MQALELQIATSERETIENENRIKDLEEQVLRARNTLDIVRAEAADDVVQKVGMSCPSARVCMRRSFTFVN